ncbi:GPI maturation protein [Niveomyces insectorum RCEF 264]|uniref:GPI inositol-deacylase n=1 Tax=Niveomyces insectorum RCEF 264 TaxID=1081102 RepID=A0A168ABH8_9HYPO|nr:GPI maturation protein [Niveomyces insectorum RCEF 264]
MQTPSPGFVDGDNPPAKTANAAAAPSSPRRLNALHTLNSSPAAALYPSDDRHIHGDNTDNVDRPHGLPEAYRALHAPSSPFPEARKLDRHFLRPHLPTTAKSRSTAASPQTFAPNKQRTGAAADDEAAADANGRQYCDAHRERRGHGLANLTPLVPGSSSPPSTTVTSASATRRVPPSPASLLSSTSSPALPLPLLSSFSPAAASPSLLVSASNVAGRKSTRYLDDAITSITTDNNNEDDVSEDNGDDNEINGDGNGNGNGNARAVPTTFLQRIVSNGIMDKPPGPIRPVLRRPRARNPWAITFPTLLVSLLGAALLGLILKSLVTRQLDPKGCRMSYMRPSYARLHDFDTEHTRFASKYSLYLYREQGVDDDTKLRGIPVLFIPGNAGSYKQVRPIAAEAANYFHEAVQHDEAALRGGARALDFFTVDFNEDITAFHGQTLLDQAEYLNEAIRYILSLYLDPRMSARDSDLPDPTSVIILGHSMGGVVARTMLIMPNYQANSINTIVTLSAPHARPPVTFDSEIVKIYDDINDYWRHAYSQQWANNNPLWHVTLVSIAGGGLDTIVPSDYASLESLVPATHGFTVFTTTIPNVWTSMDHQAILWCDQFRKVIARALYDVVDVHRATQTKPRAERMRVFKKHFLTGMETIAEKDVPSKELTTLLTLKNKPDAVVAPGKRLVLRTLGAGAGAGAGASPRPKAHLLPIPSSGTFAGDKRFTLLTDQRLDGPGDAGRLEVLVCSVFPLQSGQAGVLPIKIDLSGESSGSTRLACKNAASDVIVLPASRRSSRFPFSLTDERDSNTFSYLQYDIEHIADHQFVAVIDKAAGPTPGFVVAEFTDAVQSHRTRHASLRSLLVFGLKFRLPAERPMVTEVKIPSMQSSLLAYHLEVGSQACDGEESELFAPLVRQYLSDPFESKYYVNARQASVSIHGIAPFMPPPLSSKAPGEDGLSFQFWTDATCNSSIHVRLTVDVLGSLGKLYMRYRTVFAAFPVLVVALVLQKQFRVYDDSGVFISFSEGLDLCLRKSIPVVLAALTVLSLSVGRPQATQASAGVWSWRNATEAVVDFHMNDLLVGTQDSFYWFLIPLIGLICIGACTAVNYAALALTRVLGMVFSLASFRPGWVRHENRRQTSQQVATDAPNQHLQPQPTQQPPQQPPQPLPTQQYFSPAFIQSTPRRRVITTAVLLFLVSTVIPYQFAYLVACLVQVATTVRALRVASDLRSTVNYNFYNYAHTILIFMLWILPINLPILAVWIRNLAVHWLTPFSSHHNVLSIMPFIVLVETLTTGKMIPRVTTRLKYVTSFLLFGVAIAAAVYGVSYAYMIHHLVNVVVAWLVIVHSTGESDVWYVAVLSDLFENGTGDVKQGKSP